MSEDDWQQMDDVIAYLSQFRHASWMRIAQYVVELAGPCLSGAMDKFNDSPTNVRGYVVHITLYLKTDV
jgi:hypothetical protein